MVAAVDVDSPAIGVGSLGVFFSHTQNRSSLLLLRQVVRFARAYVDQEIEAVGSRIATQILGRTTTWKQSQKDFFAAIGKAGFTSATAAIESKVSRRAPRVVRR